MTESNHRFVSLSGPVERVGSDLELVIPLSLGGDELAKCAQGISAIEGDCLKVKIPTWLAEKLGISEGSFVSVDNRDGKLNIRPGS